jgi:hypothetical protein
MILYDWLYSDSFFEIIEAQAPAGGGSWLGRWWKRGDGTTTTGPIKASLGEESAFYYDKEQKRWVNKKVSRRTISINTQNLRVCRQDQKRL